MMGYLCGRGHPRMETRLDEVMQGVEGVFHLAALPRVSYSVDFPLVTHVM